MLFEIIELALVERNIHERKAFDKFFFIQRYGLF